jgi:hypothetical protein
MENMNAKTGKSNLNTTSKSDRMDKGISEPDIMRRAYEIYLENSINFSDELWKLLRGQTPVK